MKSYLKVLCIVITTCFLGIMANSALAQERPGGRNGMGLGMMGRHMQGYEMGHSMMGGYGMGPFIMGWGNFVGLSLSPDQKAKIKEIRKGARKKHWEAMGEMIDAHERRRELYSAEKLDPVAINHESKIIEDLRAQRRTVSIDAYNQINSVMTKEQREKSRKWWRGYHNLMWGY